LFFLIIGATFAKYVFNAIWDYYLESKGFYFTSSQLGDNTVTIMDDWDGGSISFDVKNSKSPLLITDYDINYKAECTIIGKDADYTECVFTGTNSNELVGTLSSVKACINNTEDEVDVSEYSKSDCELEGYDWTPQIAIANLSFDVNLTDNNHEIEDLTVNVKVTSLKPYRKTLSTNYVLAKNNVAAEGNVVMTYKNYQNYDRLIVSNTYDENKCVKISWDSNDLLIGTSKGFFDAFDEDNNGYINEIEFSIGAKRSVSFIFYKRDFKQTYNVSDFTLEKLPSCGANFTFDTLDGWENDYAYGDWHLANGILYVDDGQIELIRPFAPTGNTCSASVTFKLTDNYDTALAFSFWDDIGLDAIGRGGLTTAYDDELDLKNFRITEEIYIDLISGLNEIEDYFPLTLNASHTMTFEMSGKNAKLSLDGNTLLTHTFEEYSCKDFKKIGLFVWGSEQGSFEVSKFSYSTK